MLEVKRRKYRLRFLDCSVSRIYELQLMTSTNGPKSARDLGYATEAVGTVMENREPWPGIDANSIG